MTDITLTLNEQEQQALVQICDAACRFSGLQLSSAATALANRVLEAKKSTA